MPSITTPRDAAAPPPETVGQEIGCWVDSNPWLAAGAAALLFFLLESDNHATATRRRK
jgi:hypothetical protein